MSAWPIPDEVVRAFARQTWPAYSDKAPEDDPEAWVACLDAARDFLTRHRLVVLPEVDDSTIRWRLRGVLIDLVEGDYERRSATAEFYANAIMDSSMVRVIPGQPITVDKEESDAP